MNPDQTTPRSSEHWSTDNGYRRGIATSSLPSNRRDEPRDSQWSDSSTTRTTQTGTYGLGISPPPSPPGETKTTTPGQNHLIEGPVAYQPTGRFGIPTPSTSWTGINPWPLSSSLLTYHPCTNATPRLGRAPWRDLADVLEDRTQSLSPPSVELSTYHPLQTTTRHRTPTPTPSSTGTSPNKYESAPTSPRISRPTSPGLIPMMTSEPLGASSPRDQRRGGPF